MKQFFFGIILFVAVVVASYLKVTYSAQERQKDIALKISDIEEQRIADSILAVSSIDSLAQLLVESQASRDDIIARRDESEGRVADSLGQILAKQRSRIKSLSQDLKSAQKKIRSLKPNKNKKAKKSAKHSPTSTPKSKDIAEYFSARVEKLPSDLSPYERRIMIDEISEKTAQHFSITEFRLQEILKEQKLEF